MFDCEVHMMNTYTLKTCYLVQWYTCRHREHVWGVTGWRGAFLPLPGPRLSSCTLALHFTPLLVWSRLVVTLACLFSSHFLLLPYLFLSDGIHSTSITFSLLPYRYIGLHSIVYATIGLLSRANALFSHFSPAKMILS
jgi:hypothetical protein